MTGAVRSVPRLCDRCQFLWHDLGVWHTDPGVRDRLRAAAALCCRLNHRKARP